MEQLWVLTLVCISICKPANDPSTLDKNMYTTEEMCQKIGVDLVKIRPPGWAAVCTKIIRPSNK